MRSNGGMPGVQYVALGDGAAIVKVTAGEKSLNIECSDRQAMVDLLRQLVDQDHDPVLAQLAATALLHIQNEQGGTLDPPSLWTQLKQLWRAICDGTQRKQRKP